MRTLNLILFHLKVFSKNSYFLFNVFLSTTSIVILQILLSTYYKNEISDLVWKRAVLIGIWSSVITSCNVIGFQKYRGTLIYLLNSRTSSQLSLFALTVPASIFGLFSIPISFITTIIFGHRIFSVDWLFVASCLMYLISAIVVSLLFSVLFSLSSDGKIYEIIILSPVIILSGIFYNLIPNDYFYLTDILIPIGAPVKVMLSNSYNYWYLVWIGSLLIYLCAYFIILSILLKNLRKNGRFA